MKNKTYLSFGEKVGYALGDAASNLFFQTFAIFLLYYYTDIVGLPAAAVGTMFLVTRIFDTFTDPIMGAIADRTNTRWGKFRIYLLIGAIPYGLIGFFMFIGPDFNTTGRLIYAYLTYTAMMLAYTAVNVPYSSLMGVMTPSIRERSILSSFRFIFAFLAGIIVARSFIPMKDYLGGGDELLGVRLTMGIFGVASALMFMVTFFATRERVSPPPDQVSNLRADVRELLRNGPWIVVSLITIVQLITIVMRESSVIFYFKYVVGNEGGASIFLMWAKIAIITGIVANIFIMRLVDKRTLLMAYGYLAALCYGGIYFVDPANSTLLHTLNIVGSLAFGPIGVILWSMYGDCADYGEWKFYRRSTALVFSSSLFAIKLGLTLGGAIPGWLLGASGFVANEAQEADTLGMIRLLMTLFPAGLIILFASMVFVYRLNNRQLEQIEGDLALRKAV
ncbi:MAG: MFS transporter [Opitutales bacterium]|nr:MFS transporter [Opitutales bacterium]